MLSLMANDTTGYTTIINLNIHAYEVEDTIIPSIDGPVNTTYIEEGDDEKLYVIIQDDNPYNYTVYQNGTEIEYSLWYDSYYEIEIDLSNLTVGFYYFEIEAYDINGNYNDNYFEVVVELPTDPTDPADPTNPTITLDAPGFLLVAIGIISVVALTVVFRKRK